MHFTLILSLFVARASPLLSVTEPTELAAQLTAIQHSLSFFGRSLPYGAATALQVFLPAEGNENGCVQLAPREGAFVYLLLRGKCTHAKKAFLSQISGAAAVLVYHDDPAVNVTEVDPVPDSIYNNIQIPVVLVNNTVGAMLVGELRKGSAVQISLTPELAGQRSTNVELQYWFDPTNAESVQFILDFEPIYNLFAGRVDFQPKYRLRDLSTLAAANATAQCYGNQKHCVAEKHHAQADALLAEIVRQICFLKLSADTYKGIQNWFDYMKYYKSCLAAGLAKEGVPLNCFESARQTSDIEQTLFEGAEACFKGSYLSGADPHTTPNSVLEEHERGALRQNYRVVPLAFANRVPIKEGVDLSVIVSAVCSKMESPPSLCSDFFTKNIDWTSKKKKIFNAGKLIGFVLLAVAVCSTVFLYCCVRMIVKRRINNEISQFVQEHVNEYVLENSLRASGIIGIEERRLNY